MPRVTLQTLADYARHVLVAAESAAERYPVTATVRLPRLDLTAHLNDGALADAVDQGFIPAPDNQPTVGKCRIFVADPAIEGIAAPATWGQAEYTHHGFATQLAEAGLRGSYFHDLDFWQFYDPTTGRGVQSR